MNAPRTLTYATPEPRRSDWPEVALFGVIIVLAVGGIFWCALFMLLGSAFLMGFADTAGGSMSPREHLAACIISIVVGLFGIVPLALVFRRFKLRKQRQ